MISWNVSQIIYRWNMEPRVYNALCPNPLIEPISLATLITVSLDSLPNAVYHLYHDTLYALHTCLSSFSCAQLLLYKHVPVPVLCTSDQRKVQPKWALHDPVYWSRMILYCPWECHPGNQWLCYGNKTWAVWARILHSYAKHSYAILIMQYLKGGVLQIQEENLHLNDIDAWWQPVFMGWKDQKFESPHAGVWYLRQNAGWWGRSNQYTA